jgi:CRISPR/Cas system-associated protein Csm6
VKRDRHGGDVTAKRCADPNWRPESGALEIAGKIAGKTAFSALCIE